MGKSRKTVPPSSMKKYSLPLFCVSWVSPPNSKSKDDEATETDQNQKLFLVLSGGGGNARSGVKNALIVAYYDFSLEVLSESVHNCYTDEEVPYRMAVHPVDNQILCAFTNGCRLFQLISKSEADSAKISIHPLEKSTSPLDNIGEQRSLVFSRNGSLLATGGEDGHLRIYSWPEHKIVLDYPSAHKSIKDLDFSLDGEYLASLGDEGPCKIWSLSSLKAVASLSDSKGRSLGFCRFSRNSEKPALFIAMKQATLSFIGYWDVNDWKKCGEKAVEKNPISAFNISPDGKYLAVGTSEGDISILDAKTLDTYQRVKGAHIVFVTSLEFSSDSKALVSVSADSSARVTKIEKQKHNAGSLLRLFIMILFVLVAILWQRFKGDITIS
eukprot:TRINITY_DN3343_c0_g1_i1.p1 TRINITY_DN3343_c0_g1~~TRINITY_DN3343_c0_g1_i1.p1  ORF type:complete len:384 (-),score=76.04 TRINITY_DN3343_c0_g1_i1:296-1447(-)